MGWFPPAILDTVIIAQAREPGKRRKRTKTTKMEKKIWKKSIKFYRKSREALHCGEKGIKLRNQNFRKTEKKAGV
jgi:hypothetical protein